MKKDLKQLREQRGKTVAEMRALLDAAETEGRDLSDEEQAKYDKMFADQERLNKDIQREERQQELDREMAAETLRRQDDPDGEQRGGDRGAGGGEQRTTAELQMTAFRSYLRSGHLAGDGVEEFRALQAGSDTEGGYLVAPEEFMAQLIKFVDDEVFIRANANVLPPLTRAANLGVPSLDTDVSDADWTTELATGNEDSDLAFGKRNLNPHPLAKRIKVSNQLLRTGALPVEQIVRDRLGYKFGVTQEKAYLTGTGAGQPLGVYTASSDGISTGRDVSTGHTTTELRFDGLIEAKYTLKGQYWRRARWNFHRDAIKQISKLKDGEGQYIWQPDVRAGQADRILNFPFDVSEFTPNTFTTGQYVGCLGDWMHYWIVDVLTFQIQRLVELYAETNQVGFIGRYEGDGMPVLEEAFVRVKLA